VVPQSTATKAAVVTAALPAGPGREGPHCS
jgi:hypothetical protein